eukprot:gnl/Spiro4/28576_TR14133_c0_g1_i1.p1 gnl/Spiro4/28576_TR14133_c0_g1~~gnl/Spiro4/28576_TR14133_c0_g1_i1.p1  ORF type:complete len:1426 (+),score=486.35 gnl/Spiro4/28576_TR14133_c0_g1_i1:31-4278(+)
MALALRFVLLVGVLLLLASSDVHCRRMRKEKTQIQKPSNPATDAELTDEELQGKEPPAPTTNTVKHIDLSFSSDPAPLVVKTTSEKVVTKHKNGTVTTEETTYEDLLPPKLKVEEVEELPIIKLDMPIHLKKCFPLLSSFSFDTIVSDPAFHNAFPCVDDKDIQPLMLPEKDGWKDVAQKWSNQFLMLLIGSFSREIVATDRKQPLPPAYAPLQVFWVRPVVSFIRDRCQGLFTRCSLRFSNNKLVDAELLEKLFKKCDKATDPIKGTLEVEKIFERMSTGCRNRKGFDLLLSDSDVFAPFCKTEGCSGQVMSTLAMRLINSARTVDATLFNGLVQKTYPCSGMNLGDLAGSNELTSDVDACLFGERSEYYVPSFNLLFHRVYQGLEPGSVYDLNTYASDHIRRAWKVPYDPLTKQADRKKAGWKILMPPLMQQPLNGHTFYSKPFGGSCVEGRFEIDQQLEGTLDSEDLKLRTHYCQRGSCDKKMRRYVLHNDREPKDDEFVRFSSYCLQVATPDTGACRYDPQKTTSTYIGYVDPIFPQADEAAPSIRFDQGGVVEFSKRSVAMCNAGNPLDQMPGFGEHPRSFQSMFPDSEMMLDNMLMQLVFALHKVQLLMPDAAALISSKVAALITSKADALMSARVSKVDDLDSFEGLANEASPALTMLRGLIAAAGVCSHNYEENVQNYLNIVCKTNLNLLSGSTTLLRSSSRRINIDLESPDCKTFKQLQKELQLKKKEKGTESSAGKDSALHELENRAPNLVMVAKNRLYEFFLARKAKAEELLGVGAVDSDDGLSDTLVRELLTLLAVSYSNEPMITSAAVHHVVLVTQIGLTNIRLPAAWYAVSAIECFANLLWKLEHFARFEDDDTDAYTFEDRVKLASKYVSRIGDAFLRLEAVYGLDFGKNANPDVAMALKLKDQDENDFLTWLGTQPFDPVSITKDIYTNKKEVEASKRIPVELTAKAPAHLLSRLGTLLWGNVQLRKKNHPLVVRADHAGGHHHTLGNAKDYDSNGKYLEYAFASVLTRADLRPCTDFFVAEVVEGPCQHVENAKELEELRQRTADGGAFDIETLRDFLRNLQWRTRDSPTSTTFTTRSLVKTTKHAKTAALDEEVVNAWFKQKLSLAMADFLAQFATKLYDTAVRVDPDNARFIEEFITGERHDLVPLAMDVKLCLPKTNDLEFEWQLKETSEDEIRESTRCNAPMDMGDRQSDEDDPEGSILTNECQCFCPLGSGFLRDVFPMDDSPEIKNKQLQYDDEKSSELAQQLVAMRDAQRAEDLRTIKSNLADLASKEPRWTGGPAPTGNILHANVPRIVRSRSPRLEDIRLLVSPTSMEKEVPHLGKTLPQTVLAKMRDPKQLGGNIEEQLNNMLELLDEYVNHHPELKDLMELTMAKEDELRSCPARVDSSVYWWWKSD